MASSQLLCDLCDVGGVELSEAIGLAGEAAEVLRQQQRPEMAAAVESLRTAVMVTTEESLTPSQVARLIGRHRNTVRNWVNQGLIRAVKIGPRGDLRVPRSEAERVRETLKALDAGGYLTRRQIEEEFEERRAMTRERRARKRR